MHDKKSDDFVIGKKRGSESDSLEVGSVEASSADSNLTERLRKFDVAKSALQTAISQRAFLTQPQ